MQIHLLIYVLVTTCCSLSLAIQGANYNWVCQGCDNTKFTTSIVYGLIHRSLHDYSIGSHFMLEHQWTARILRPSAKVNVTVIQGKSLDSLSVPADIFLDSLPPSPFDETFQILFASLPRYLQFWSKSYPGISIIDHFLAQNPCWLVLYEPSNLGGLNSSYVPSTSHRPHSTRRYVIFVKMPIYPLLHTCRLYTFIQKVQFPATCSKNSSDYIAQCIGNIGWTSNIKLIRAWLAYSINQQPLGSKTLVIPGPEEFRYVPRYSLSANGTKQERYRGWAWAEESTCPPELDRYDPWSCNFIPLTKCGLPQEHVRLILPLCKEHDERVFYPPTPDDLLHYLDISQTTRAAFGDAPFRDNDDWASFRLAAYIQRPNYRLRQFIRYSVNQLTVISPLKRPENQTRNANELAGQISGPTSSSRLPCLALHVRHGDSGGDSRGESGIDRSFERHMRCVRNISLPLGISTIFLATDNLTVVRLAPQLYPEYIWTTQKRPLSATVRMYRHFYETDVQFELSHVLAEFVLMSRCRALVAAFDSGMAKVMMWTMSGSVSLSDMPTYIDISDTKLC